MTRKVEKNVKTVALELEEVKQALMAQKDFLVPVVQQTMQAMLELEMEESDWSSDVCSSDLIKACFTSSNSNATVFTFFSTFRVMVLCLSFLGPL